MIPTLITNISIQKDILNRLNMKWNDGFQTYQQLIAIRKVNRTENTLQS